MPIDNTPIKKGSVINEEKNDNRNKKMVFLAQEPKYSFDDMVLPDKLKEEIDDAISVYQYREKLFGEWNLSKVIKKPSNVCMNFYGYPGTGKTMAANAIAAKLGKKIIKVNYAEIESKYVGETSKNLVKLFHDANEMDAIIVFDEADALLSRRVTDMHSATDVSVNQTRSVLLTLLDEFTGMVIFTTNFISNYDPAFMRRIPTHIEFGVPNKEQRIELLKHYLTDTVPNDIDINCVADKYEGITGSDIANALVSGAVKTVRNNSGRLSTEVFSDCIEQILKAKSANNGVQIKVMEREVSEEYALDQISKGGNIK